MATHASSDSFPTGLVQPKGSFRFSVDALQLVAFAAQHKPDTFADLGTGCGVVALGLLRQFPKAQAVGIEKHQELVAAAEHNALQLGVNTPAHRRFKPLHHDLEDLALLQPFAHSFDMVCANPPWRLIGAGRIPPSTLRRDALFGNPETLFHFVRAAALLLAPKGVFVSIISPERLQDMFAALEKTQLNPSRIQCVHASHNTRAQFVLIEAFGEKNKALHIEVPRFLQTD